MDLELISYALGLAIFGGFVWAMAFFSFKQGLEVGKRMAIAPMSLPISKSEMRQIVAPPVQSQGEMQQTSRRERCAECGGIDLHASDCRGAKPKPDRRRWMGFSRIKAELENKESVNVATQ